MININWLNFTPIESFAGGLLIGCSAILLMLSSGKIMGVSGLLTNIFFEKNNNHKYDLILFFIFLLIGPILYIYFLGDFNSVSVANPSILVVAGLLVGIGTSIGNGCTSGHGICGLSRFSFRSLVATITFVGSGILTVYFLG